MPEPSGRRTSITTRSGWNRRGGLDRLGDRARLGDDLEARAGGRASRRGPGGRPRGRRRPATVNGRACGRSVVLGDRHSIGPRLGSVDRDRASRHPGSLSTSSVAPSPVGPGAHVGEALMADRRADRHVEAVAIVARPRGAGCHRRRSRSAPTTRDAAEWRATLLSASLTMPSRCAVTSAGGSQSGPSRDELDVDHRVVPELVDQRGQPVDRATGRPAAPAAGRR